VCRLLSVAVFLNYLWRARFGEWALVGDALWQPTPIFELLGLRPVSPDLLQAMGVTCKVALAGAAIGLMTRTSCLLAAVLTFYLLGLTHCFGKVNRADAIVPVILLILAVARSGDAWSADAVIKRARARGPAHDPPAAEYGWPVRVVWLLAVSVFFAAGMAKLLESGLSWAFSENLRDILIGQHYVELHPFGTLGFAIAEHPTLYVPLAIGILAVETLSPLALFSTTARAVIVPALLLFIVSLPALFGFSFPPYYGMLAFWVPWNRVGVAFVRRTRTALAGSAATS
jgi:hypothetical protein